MSSINLSEDQEIVFDTISKWIANGGIVHPKQKNKKLLTLGGFAGSGKTVLTSHIAKIFEKSVRFAFCALSGRAASVLGRKLREQDVKFSEDGHYCGTIHRLIYKPVENNDGEVIYWDKKESLDYDLIILDEASMISENIFKDLSSYGVDILAVGDHGQLPPIEGKFSLMQDPILRLDKIHRQAQDNPIINLSMEIRENGIIPKGYKSNQNISVIKKNEYIDFLRQTYKTIKGPEALLDTAVVCYTNATRTKLNTMIRNIVYGNVSKDPFIDDLVICLRNVLSHKKEPIYNGFRGYFSGSIENCDDDFLCAKIRFPFEGIEQKFHNILKHQFGFSKTFSSFSELENFGMNVKHWNEVGVLFDYGYAMTGHKMQGDQADNVIFFNERPAPVTDDNYKRWAYSCVTRSSNKLTLIL